MTHKEKWKEGPTGIDYAKYCIDKMAAPINKEDFKKYSYYTLSHLIDYCMKLEKRIIELENKSTVRK